MTSSADLVDLGRGGEMSMSHHYRQSFGIGDQEVIADTADKTARDFQAIQVVTDAVIESITAPQLTGASSLAGLTLKAGFTLLTHVTQIKLTSGVVIGHKAVS